MTRDIYYDAKQLAAKLENKGLKSEARSINEVISAGATGTEIMMGLRFHLQMILKKRILRSSELRNQIEDLAEAINAVLR